METIGERVKRIREKRDIGQTELAARVSMSPQAIWNLENGIVGKTFSKLPALAKALGCRIDDLFPEMDDPGVEMPSKAEAPETETAADDWPDGWRD